MASKENQEALNIYINLRYLVDKKTNNVLIVPPKKCSPLTLINMIFNSTWTLQQAIDRLEFIEKQFTIIDRAITIYIAKNLGITKNENGIYNYNEYAKILDVRKELVKLAKEELESEKQNGKR